MRISSPTDKNNYYWKLVQILVIIVLMWVTAELNQKGSARLTVVGWSEMFVIKYTVGSSCTDKWHARVFSAPASALPQSSGERGPQSLECTSRFVFRISSRSRRIDHNSPNRTASLRWVSTEIWPWHICWKHRFEGSSHEYHRQKPYTVDQSNGCHALLQGCCIDMFPPFLLPLRDGDFSIETVCFSQKKKRSSDFWLTFQTYHAFFSASIDSPCYWVIFQFRFFYFCFLKCWHVHLSVNSILNCKVRYFHFIWKLYWIVWRCWQMFSVHALTTLSLEPWATDASQLSHWQEQLLLKAGADLGDHCSHPNHSRTDSEGKCAVDCGRMVRNVRDQVYSGIVVHWQVTCSCIFCTPPPRLSRPSGERGPQSLECTSRFVFRISSRRSQAKPQQFLNPIHPIAQQSPRWVSTEIWPWHICWKHRFQPWVPLLETLCGWPVRWLSCTSARLLASTCLVATSVAFSVPSTLVSFRRWAMSSSCIHKYLVSMWRMPPRPIHLPSVTATVVSVSADSPHSRRRDWTNFASKTSTVHAQYSASGDVKAMSPCVSQRKLMSAPLSHTMGSRGRLPRREANLPSLCVRRCPGVAGPLRGRSSNGMSRVPQTYSTILLAATKLTTPWPLQPSAELLDGEQDVWRVPCPRWRDARGHRAASTGFSSASVGCLVRIPGVVCVSLRAAL